MRVGIGDPTNQIPRDKKLKENIIRLRKKSKENVIKIKCLQNKIRRILMQKTEKSNEKTHPTKQSLKIQKLFPDNDSTDSESLPPSPSTDVIAKIDFDSETDSNIKREPDEEFIAKAPSIPAEMDTKLIDQKTTEDDPLQICNGYND